MPAADPVESEKSYRGSDDELQVESAATNWWKGANVLLLAFLVYSITVLLDTDWIAIAVIIKSL